MLSFISAGDSPEKVRRGAGAAVFAVGNVLGSPLKAEVAGIPPKKRWPPVAAADDAEEEAEGGGGGGGEGAGGGGGKGGVLGWGVIEL